MWIMHSDCFLSIVSKDCGPTELLLQARRNGDIEKVFPSAKVVRSTGTDYLYRAVIPRDAVKQAITAMIDHIDYPNFKDSVEDSSLRTAYAGVWHAMAGLQHPPPDIERATHARSALTSNTVASVAAFRRFWVACTSGPCFRSWCARAGGRRQRSLPTLPAATPSPRDLAILDYFVQTHAFRELFRRLLPFAVAVREIADAARVSSVNFISSSMTSTTRS